VRKPTVWGVPINLGDLFHQEVPSEFIAVAFGVMAAASRHTFAVVTKRWARVPAWMEWMMKWSGGLPMQGLWVGMQRYSCHFKAPVHEDKYPTAWPLPNVIVMASAWDQASADDAARHLAPLGIQWGLHLEPMLGPVNMRQDPRKSHYGYSPPCWIACGAENGPRARPMLHGWACQLRDQCAAAGVPFWLKGLGRGKGRELDGREHNEVPW